jgi:[ribosomal protein S18]-alanine N-acetyltransferase
MTELRPARWWDIPAMAAVDRALFGPDAWSVETFWSELAGVPDRRWYRVALADDAAVIGYVGLGVNPPTADVQTLAVRADHQGFGCGGRLLDALLAEAIRRGCHEVLLEVRADNVAALALYERRGFTTIATRKRYYTDGTDALILRQVPGWTR